MKGPPSVGGAALDAGVGLIRAPARSTSAFSSSTLPATSSSRNGSPTHAPRAAAGAQRSRTGLLAIAGPNRVAELRYIQGSRRPTQLTSDRFHMILPLRVTRATIGLRCRFFTPSCVDRHHWYRVKSRRDGLAEHSGAYFVANGRARSRAAVSLEPADFDAASHRPGLPSSAFRPDQRMSRNADLAADEPNSTPLSGVA